MSDVSSKNCVVVIPVYDDWLSLEKLLSEMAKLTMVWRLTVVIVDDGSNEAPVVEKLKRVIQSNVFAKVKILHLGRNVGHQRAIALGLMHTKRVHPDDCVLVMDADGEDRPEDIPLLLAAFEKEGCEGTLVVARKRRQENFLFRFCYFFYKRFFRLFTGKFLNFGNFSVMSQDSLARVLRSNDVISHFAGTVLKTERRLRFIELDRGSRFFGKSKMNFISLITHGLEGVFVFAENILVRALIGCIGVMALAAVGLVAVVLIRVLTELAIAGWASMVALGLFGIFLQAILSALVITFLLLQSLRFRVLTQLPVESQFVARVQEL